MRQIGTDMNTDPREPVVTKEIPAADLANPANSSAFNQFAWNKFAEMAHKYCTNGTVNLGKGAMGEAEGARFKTCLRQYSQAFKIYEEEESVHARAMHAIESAGGDKFAKFNEYDRY